MTPSARPPVFRLTPSPGPKEHDIQAAFVRLCRFAEVREPRLRLAFAVTNGGYRLSAAAAAKLAAEGLRPGVPDWLLPLPMGRYAGLAIEFKRPAGGRVSEAQRDYMTALQKAGWCVMVATCPFKAFNAVTAYLALR